MDAIRRTSTLRRVATTASLAALLVVPAQASAATGHKSSKAKAPVITSVRPMKLKVGQTLTIVGRNFRKGKGRNSVGFKRDGAAVVFVKSDLSTHTKMTVKLPARLEKVMFGKVTRFHLRVLATKFGKRFTSNRLSPRVVPRPNTDGEGTNGGTETTTPPQVTGPANDCDDDGTKNADDTDDDNDLLPDSRENEIGTDGCKPDTDADGVTDGYEYRSAIDLWIKLTNPKDRTLEDQGTAATPLTYSDGLQYSVGRRCGAGETGGPCGVGDTNHDRRVPTLTGDNYDKYQNFLAWLHDAGYENVALHDSSRWFNYSAGWHQYSILDVDRSTVIDPSERTSLDTNGDGFLSDDERDEDADGLVNVDEIRSRMTPSYWTACYKQEPPYTIAYAGTDPADGDTDDDGIRDGADDQDHDDVPNLMELSRMAASHLNDTDDGVDGTVTGGDRQCKADKDLKVEDKRHPDAFGKVNPFNPCDPDPESRTCELHPLIGSEPGPDWWSLQ